ncbi:hypothetical protein DB032_15715 [Chromobacterium sp. Panama]|uniref:hypothetical protein n=1 Tax=Chromobacterium sp. Panama TaxID=2161826 RepID=UPI000D32322F|nr:hypothetical protein [Chromobacterium sp. Panama]PTU66271.1 hypothetical protein DB032_15715 [Chromobacterium sp. Panama]
MMNLVIRQHQTIKKAVQVILAYEAQHGSVSNVCPAQQGIDTEFKQEMKLTMDLYYHWMRKLSPSMRQGFLSEFTPLLHAKPRNDAAWAAIRELWASGKWKNRDTCVRACYKQVGFSNMAEARLALVRQPSPPSV